MVETQAKILPSQKILSPDASEDDLKNQLAQAYEEIHNFAEELGSLATTVSEVNKEKTEMVLKVEKLESDAALLELEREREKKVYDQKLHDLETKMHLAEAEKEAMLRDLHPDRRSSTKAVFTAIDQEADLLKGSLEAEKKKREEAESKLDAVQSELLSQRASLELLKDRVQWEVTLRHEAEEYAITHKTVKEGEDSPLKKRMTSRELRDISSEILRLSLKSDVLTDAQISAEFVSGVMRYLDELRHPGRGHATSPRSPSSVVDFFQKQASRALLMTSTFGTKPKWVPDEQESNCYTCREAFTFVRRKHHCRNCGFIFCGSCSAHSIPLAHIGLQAKSRVCDTCFVMVMEIQPPSS